MKRTSSSHGASTLMLGAIGVVFGDIGTSPLYSLHETFAGAHPIAESRADVFGVLSLVFWSITVIVTLKYVSFVMRADNAGEGGIMALVALVLRATATSARVRRGVIVLGLIGAALFYADGAITPAISVLSAVEGLQVIAPSLHSVVVPVTIAIVILLAAIQRYGTHVVGRMFGPVMVLWFLVIGLLGAFSAMHTPSIFAALSPSYGARFVMSDPRRAFLSLGAIVLTVTGAEALYADMGHFGRAPISRSWFALVLPALMLNYLGQSALLLRTPGALDNPFYRLAPTWALWPLVLLATFATIIASQAVISGAFSVTRQAIQLGYMPRLLVRHTSAESIGQVYVPVVNWALLLAIVGLVLAFPSSASLASAYGIAVTGTLVINTVLAACVVTLVWNRSRIFAALIAGPLLLVEALFLASNLTKVLSGGWVPLLTAGTLASVFWCWVLGRERVFAMREDEVVPLTTYLEELNAMPTAPVRIPGTAVYLNASGDRVPLALRYNVAYNHVLHDNIVVAHVEIVDAPYVDPWYRLSVDEVRDDINIVHVLFGYQESPDLPAALAALPSCGVAIDEHEITYYLSQVQLIPTDSPGMARWRKHLYSTMVRHATPVDRYFCLPQDRVISLGSYLAI